MPINLICNVLLSHCDFMCSTVKKEMVFFGILMYFYVFSVFFITTQNAIKTRTIEYYSETRTTVWQDICNSIFYIKKQKKTLNKQTEA